MQILSWVFVIYTCIGGWIGGKRTAGMPFLKALYVGFIKWALLWPYLLKKGE